ncbi:50S ribosomal protein L29 [Candidatus Roizmanbacteria bacterium]|nr:50S ribosomal protein L29 [Candidatus Roizmanbacteria bacterium]
MKKKAKQQIMQKKAKELETLVVKKREELVRLKLKANEEKNKNSMRNLKHEIALMLTVLREQQIIEETAGGGTHE